jgi:hypothetical protein
MLLATTAIAPAPWVKLPVKPVTPSTAVEVVLTVGAAWLDGPAKPPPVGLLREALVVLALLLPDGADPEI